jgi:Phage integrase, N-terminal SAM-like domain
MRKAKGNPLPTLVESFFTHYLITERHLSPCTVASYRDTCRLLLTYLEAQNHRSASAQRLEDWDAPNILSFLAYLEKERGCCARSRNLRLAAIHCFMKYVAQRSPEFLALASRVLAIPTKRHAQPLLGYLTAPEVQAILDATDPTTSSGRRDRLFFQLLYNCSTIRAPVSPNWSPSTARTSWPAPAKPLPCMAKVASSGRGHCGRKPLGKCASGSISCLQRLGRRSSPIDRELVSLVPGWKSDCVVPPKKPL